MISIYNINKFVTSCGGGWLIQACRVRVVFASFFSSRCWVQVLRVVTEYLFYFFHFLSICYLRFFPAHLLRWALLLLWWNNQHSLPLQYCQCVTVHVVTGRTRGQRGFRGICGRCLGKNKADGDMKCSLVRSPQEEVLLLSAAGEDGAQFLVPSSTLRSCWRL